MEFPSLEIGNFRVSLPIIQGGMAIRISTAQLAAAVAREGGIGIIAGTGMSVAELKDEILKAKDLAQGKGKIGVNVLFAVTNFAALVKEAMEAGIDLFIYGAGFSKDVFKLGKDYGCPVVPIVSSARLAVTSEKLGAAGVVVEGYEAGGHLGTDRSVKELVPEVKKAVDIPVVAAGGITTGEDIYNLMNLGAKGVQIATRFAASLESNASKGFKEVYLASKEGDSVIIDSPVGLPGRAVKTSFSKKILQGEKIPIEECTHCLKRCSRTFCLKRALENAQEGKVESGLVFAGRYVHRMKEILSVKEIIHRFKVEFAEACNKYGRIGYE
ncbi:MAG: nitronate monooxygenase [Bacillota bacterium]